MRVAIVDDLALARDILRRLVLSVPGYSVAWTAENGEMAVQKAKADRPDVILMDLVMPVMDGVEATRRITAENPCPILIVTSSVSTNYGKVFQALGSGGLDAVNTPTAGCDGKIYNAEPLLNRLAKLEQTKNPPMIHSGTFVIPTALRDPKEVCPMVAIGASTGGTEAVAQILRSLPKDFPAALVLIQHIDPDFVAGLATWLQSNTSLKVKVATPGEKPQPGTVHIACSNDHLTLAGDNTFRYTPEPKDYPYRPSVDAFFMQAAATYPKPGVAVLLTGMGADGAKGLLKLKQAKWHTIAQNEATCVIYGMPHAAVQMGAANEVLPLERISSAVQLHVNR